MVKIANLPAGTDLGLPSLDYDNHFLPVDDVAAVKTERYKLSDFVHGYSTVTGPSSGNSIEGVAPADGDLVLLSVQTDAWVFSNTSSALLAEYTPARKVSSNTFRVLPVNQVLRWVSHPFGDVGEPLGFDDAKHVLYLQDDNSLSDSITAASASRIVKACKVIDVDHLLFLPYRSELDEKPITSTGQAVGESTGTVNYDFNSNFSRFAYTKAKGDLTLNLSAVEGGEYVIKLDNTEGHTITFGSTDLGLGADLYLIRFYYDNVGTTLYHTSTIVLFETV